MTRTDELTAIFAELCKLRDRLGEMYPEQWAVVAAHLGHDALADLAAAGATWRPYTAMDPHGTLEIITDWHHGAGAGDCRLWTAATGDEARALGAKGAPAVPTPEVML